MAWGRRGGSTKISPGGVFFEQRYLVKYWCYDGGLKIRNTLFSTRNTKVGVVGPDCRVNTG
jgi:hypothetical protein